MFHATLFALYPSLFLYSKNIGEFSALSTVRLGSIVLALSLAGCVILGAALRSRERAALIISGLLVLGFTFGHARPITRSGVSSGALLAIFGLAAALWVLGAWKTTIEIRTLSRLATVIGSTLVGLCLIDIGVYQVRVAARDTSAVYSDDRMARTTMEPDSRLTRGRGASRPPDGAAPRAALPDIYLIILDAYARADVLKELYGNDNSLFLNRLRELGFQVAARATSNYNQTRFSVASMLNLRYLDDAAKRIGYLSGDQVPLMRMVQEALVFSFLEQEGYATVAFAPVYLRGDMPASARFVTVAPEVDVFRLALLNMTPLPEIARYWGGELHEPDAIDRHRSAVDFKLGRLAEAHELFESPKFVFVHIEAPHPPFVFRRDGTARSPKRGYQFNKDGDLLLRSAEMSRHEYRMLYLDQLLYINDKVLTAIESILANSATPPIILLVGDHGPRSGFVWNSAQQTDQRESLGVLGAYHLPGAPEELIYPELSLVNVFRLVFNQYFDGEYELLQDRNFYSTKDRPYQFHDVTNRVQSSR